MPHLSDVARGIDKALEVLVADLVLVHVEAAQVHSAGWPLSILLNLGLLGAHGEHPSWDQHHLHSKQPRGRHSDPLTSPTLLLLLIFAAGLETAFWPAHLGKQQTELHLGANPRFSHEAWVVLVLS